MPRTNGQIERLNTMIINVLVKMSFKEPGQWYRHAPRVQMALNGSYYRRSFNITPFELVFGVEMKQPENQSIEEARQHEYMKCHEEKQEEDRRMAKAQIPKVKIQQQCTFLKLERMSLTTSLGT